MLSRILHSFSHVSLFFFLCNCYVSKSTFETNIIKLIRILFKLNLIGVTIELKLKNQHNLINRISTFISICTCNRVINYCLFKWNSEKALASIVLVKWGKNIVVACINQFFNFSALTSNLKNFAEYFLLLH